MENASKALIIAGAILISLVLVSLGVMLISRTGNTQEESEKVSQAIEDKTTQAGDAAKGWADKITITPAN